MNCTEAGMFLETIQTLPGYWRKNNQSDELYPCNDEENCVGGVVSEQCEENNAGVLCGVCSDQHVRVGADCIACPPGQGRGGNSSVGIVVGFTPCVVLFAVLIYYFARREKKKDIIIKTKNVTKVAPVLKDRKDATSTLKANYQNAKAKKEDGGGKKKEDAPPSLAVVQNTASTASALISSAGASVGNAVGDTVQKVVEEEAENQTISKSLRDGAEEQSRAMVEDEVAGAAASASGDTTEGEIVADTDRAMQEDIMHEAEAALMNISSRVSGRLRILIGFVQIMAGLASGFTIPWPPMFLSLINFVTFINFDFVGLLGGLDACSLYSPFLTSAAFHMAILPLFAMMVVAAAIVARCCLRNKASVVSKRAKGIMLELMMFLYREYLLV